MGLYDVQVFLAQELGWTPEMVDEQDPDYIEQILANYAAKGRYRASQKKTPKVRVVGRGGHIPGPVGEPDPDFRWD